MDAGRVWKGRVVACFMYDVFSGDADQGLEG